MYGIPRAVGVKFSNSYGGDLSSGMIFSRNYIQIPSGSTYTAEALYDISAAWSLTDNKYYSDKTDSQQFTVSGANKSLTEWQMLTGDTSVFEQVTFPDSTRDLAGYMASIGGTATVDGFISAVRSQDRYSWNPAYTAPKVNEWIKEGFGLAPYKHLRLKAGGKLLRVEQ